MSGGSAYRAYGYLSDPAAAVSFEMSAQLDRVPSAAPILGDEERARLARVVEQHPVISAHEHLGVRPVHPEDFAAYRHQGREVTGYRGLLASGVDAFFDGGVAGVSMIHSHAGWGWQDTIHDIGMRLADWHHSGVVDVITTLDGLRAKRAGARIGVVLTLECATPIGNEIDKLDVLYGLGVRSMGVTYSESNLLGSGLAEQGDGGLTRFGRACVRRMNDLGILIDVSHCGDRTALDVVEASEAPVVITHAGARAVWPTRRMKSDEVIEAVARSGGLIGIEAAPNTTRADADGAHDLEAVMRHFRHCLDLVGPEHVAIGPDTHFGDHAAWHRHFARALSSNDRPGDPAFRRSEYVDGAENPAEATINLLGAVAQSGVEERDLAAIAGGNIIRCASAAWVR